MSLFIWAGAGYKYYCYHVCEIGSPPIRFLPATVRARNFQQPLCRLSTDTFRSSPVSVPRSNVTRQRSFLVGAATAANQLSFLGERSDSFIATERERANTLARGLFSCDPRQNIGCVRRCVVIIDDNSTCQTRICTVKKIRENSPGDGCRVYVAFRARKRNGD